MSRTSTHHIKGNADARKISLLHLLQEQYLLIPSARWPGIYCSYQSFFNTEYILTLEQINHMEHKVVWKTGHLFFRSHCL